jgi:hypothetical protein
MDCPSRVDPLFTEAYNHNGIETDEQNTAKEERNTIGLKALDGKGNIVIEEEKALASGTDFPSNGSDAGASGNRRLVGRGILQKVLAVLRKYIKFVGPGFMVAVAYIDPGTLFFQFDTSDDICGRTFTYHQVPILQHARASIIPSPFRWSIEIVC